MKVVFGRFGTSAVIACALLAGSASGAFAQTTQTFVSPALLKGITLATTTPPTVAARQEGGIGFGVLGGIAKNSLDAEGLEAFIENKLGTLLGLWVGGNRNGRVGFTGEFIYVFRKADTPLGELSYPAFELPAVVHVNFGSPDSALGYAIVGPVFTFNLTQSLDGVDIDDDVAFKGADVGIMAGGGFEIFRVAVEVRGNWGLRNISSEGDIVETRTRSVEFLVKFRIN